jgi:hypothetical protein
LGKIDAEAVFEDLAFTSHKATDYYDAGEAAGSLAIDFNKLSVNYRLSFKHISSEKALSPDKASVLEPAAANDADSQRE